MNPTLSNPHPWVWPCRKGAIDKVRARFEAVSRKQLWQWFNKLKRWKRIKDLPGAGRAVQLVYLALMDMIDKATGRLDPGYVKIADEANCSRSTVHIVLRILREIGVLTWDQCCTRGPGPDGRFQIRQDTNAYRFLPPEAWIDYVDKTPPPPPPPDPETCGAPAGVASPAQLFAETGGPWSQRLDALAVDPLDEVASGLARLGRFVRPPPD